MRERRGRFGKRAPEPERDPHRARTLLAWRAWKEKKTKRRRAAFLLAFETEFAIRVAGARLGEHNKGKPRVLDDWERDYLRAKHHEEESNDEE